MPMGLVRYVLGLNAKRKSRLKPWQAGIAAAKIANYPHGRSEKSKSPNGDLLSREAAAKAVGASLKHMDGAQRVDGRIVKIPIWEKLRIPSAKIGTTIPSRTCLPD